MPSNNAIDAPSPIDSRLGGTGVVAPELYGIMIGAAGNPIHTTVLDDTQVLLGFTGDFPEPVTLLAGTNITFDQAPGSFTINSPPSDGFTWTILPPSTGSPFFIANLNGYVTSETVIGNKVSFTLETGTGPLVGDEIRMGAYGTGSVGFFLRSFYPAQKFWWNGLPYTELNFTGPGSSVHILCTDNTVLAQQYLVLGLTGTVIPS